MAVPKIGYLVNTPAGSVLVFSGRDAKTYPGRTAPAQTVVVHKGDNGTPDLPQYYVLHPLFHATEAAPPLVFDKLAADARQALRDAALAKLTQAERDACGLSGVDT